MSVAVPLDPSLREQLKAAIDERIRQVAFHGVCPWCLGELPEDRHPLKQFCSRSCSNNASAERQRARKQAA